MHRYKLTLEYIGKGYCGWQKQKEALALQEIIERAITQFSQETTNLIVAGRTDSGVNAYAQVAHFDLEKYHYPKRIIESINHFVRPHKIGVIDCTEVSKDFHARFSARSRHYLYKILNRPAISIINQNLEYWIRQELDVKQMQIGANYLIGKHDFTSFRASECQANSAIRTLDKIEIIKQAQQIEIYFSALSFLHHMVRNIVGSLIMVGRNKWPPEKIKEILEARDRTKSAATAPAHGLYFLKVDY